jgi:hypothetical protein
VALHRPALLILTLASAALLGCTSDNRGSGMTLSSGPNFDLHYNDQGDSVSLAYGEANSDNVALMLQCEKGAGRVQVSDQVRAGLPPALVLASSGQRSELLSRVEAFDGGPSIIVADTTTDAAALKGFRKTGELVVGDGETAYGVEARGLDRAEVDLFFTACEQAA